MNLNNDLFVLALALLFAVIFAWGFRALPAEDWQMIASVPMSKDERGVWRGLNLTFYGAFVATACAFGAATIFVLMSAISASIFGVTIIVAGLLIFCFPAASIVARIVERKRHTFTVGGAAFIGALAAPLIVSLVNQLLAPHLGFAKIAPAPLFAALSIAYAFSEAFGRLACISFGCCYGKPLTSVHPSLQKIFKRRHFVFTGETKKVAYEGELAGVAVVPIQAVTAIVFTLAGLVATSLFLRSHWRAAMLTALIATQGWRIISEFLRADFRGNVAGGQFTAYQLMGASTILYALALVPLIDTDASNFAPDILRGLSVLLNFRTILALEVLWLFVFLRLGRSSVTGAQLSFWVIRERI
jgi:uncharacterized membrane protein YvlD (DUF360 family)